MQSVPAGGDHHVPQPWLHLADLAGFVPFCVKESSLHQGRVDGIVPHGHRAGGEACHIESRWIGDALDLVSPVGIDRVAGRAGGAACRGAPAGVGGAVAYVVVSISKGAAPEVRILAIATAPEFPGVRDFTPVIVKPVPDIDVILHCQSHSAKAFFYIIHAILDFCAILMNFPERIRLHRSLVNLRIKRFSSSENGVDDYWNLHKTDRLADDWEFDLDFAG